MIWTFKKNCDMNFIKKSYIIIRMNKNKLQEVELEYCEKLKQAKLEDNHDKMMMLFFELNVLRKRFSTSRSIYKKGKSLKVISG